MRFRECVLDFYYHGQKNVNVKFDWLITGNKSTDKVLSEQTGGWTLLLLYASLYGEK